MSEARKEIESAPVIQLFAIVLGYLGTGPLFVMLAYWILAGLVFPEAAEVIMLPTKIGWVQGFFIHIAANLLGGDMFGLKFYHIQQNSRMLRILTGRN